MDRLVLGGVSVNLESMDLELGEVAFDWTPRRLLRRELLVNELTVTTVRAQSKPVEPPPEEPLTWPVELPAINPPVDVIITTIDISDVEFVSTPDAEPLVIDVAGLAAALERGRGHCAGAPGSARVRS